MRETTRKLKRELFAASAAVLMSAIALGSATYAWYASNTSVKATTSTISAKANNFVLQIAKLSDGAQHGDNQSLVAASTGHQISPSSTDDLTTWWASGNWGQDGLVHSYINLKTLGLDSEGKYTADKEHYAYLKSEYILYTINQTGFCDVYLDGSDPDGAIQVTAEDSPTSSRVIPDSMRVGITIQPMNGDTPTGDEKLVVVYAPKNETGKGNDATALEGWTCVKTSTSLAQVTYPHVFEKTYTWTDSSSNVHNYAATKDGENYIAPAVNAAPIATNVGYDGVVMRVYIWLEGTDSDCVNNSNQDDPSTYNVTVNLVGVSV